MFVGIVSISRDSSLVLKAAREFIYITRLRIRTQGNILSPFLFVLLSLLMSESEGCENIDHGQTTEN